MKRSMVETVLGAVVLFGALAFLMFSYRTANVESTGGYNISADFQTIGGLKIGDEVRISGVKVGQITKIILDPNTFMARVTMDVDPRLKLATDTMALVSSQSLLGGFYLSLVPGVEEDRIENGGSVALTQSPQSLEELLGKFIFSMTDSKKSDTGTDQAAP